MFTTFKQNLTFCLRTFAKSPGFIVTVILTIALGIGASTAIFSVLYATLFEKLPYPKSEQLMMLWSQPGGGRNVVSAGDFLDWKKRNTTFQDMNAWSGGSFNLATNDRPERVEAVASTPGFNKMVGTEFLLGRDFVAEEGASGNEHVVILTHKLWNTHFGADRGIVGKQIRMNGEPYTVVGVFAPGLADRRGSEVSVPLVFKPDQINHDNHWILVMGRIKDGVTQAQAQADMSGIAAQLAQEFPKSNKDWKVSVEPLHLNFLPNTTQRRLWLLQGAVGFLLLIACVNVANLLLARSATRRREVGLRAALGATRTRIFGQLLTESLMLSIIGGVLGVLLASFLIKAIIAILPVNFLPIEADIRISVPVLLFTIGATVLSGLIFGCIPAWQATRVDLNEVLKQGGRTGSGNGKRGLRRALVVAEFALALTTLAAGGLTLKSFWNLSRTDLGINTEHVLTFDLPASDKRFPEVKNIVPYYRQVLERIESVPGVRSAALTSGMPTRGMGFGMGFRIVGGPPIDDSALPGCAFGLITAGYHETLGVRITKGRGFDKRDTETSMRVALINEKLAQTYFAGIDPIGQRVAVNEIIPPGKLGPPIEWQIVGVFHNVRNDGLRNDYPEIDVPFWQMPWPGIAALVRTEGDPTAVTRGIATAISSFDPDLPLAGVTTLDAVVSEQFAPDRFALALFGGFAIAALLLAAIGVYGVMAFGVAQRTQEFGIRMALGAQSNRVMKMVLQEATILALIGSAIGIAGAYAVGRLMQSTLYGVPAFDTLAFLAMVGVLLIAALLASFLPAWRASRVDPIDALRSE